MSADIHLQFPGLPDDFADELMQSGAEWATQFEIARRVDELLKGRPSKKLIRTTVLQIASMAYAVGVIESAACFEGGTVTEH